MQRNRNPCSNSNNNNYYSKITLNNCSRKKEMDSNHNQMFNNRVRINSGRLSKASNKKFKV